MQHPKLQIGSTNLLTETDSPISFPDPLEHLGAGGEENPDSNSSGNPSGGSGDPLHNPGNGLGSGIADQPDPADSEPHEPTTWYVNAQKGSDNYDGTYGLPIPSEHLGPKRTIEGAIAAAYDGDTVVIAPGTYKLGEIDVTEASLTIIPQGQVTIGPP